MKNIVCKNPVFQEDGHGWFIDERYNQVYKIDLATDQVHYIGHFDGIRFQRGSRWLVKKCGQDLYIFPKHSKESIIVYNLENNSYQEIMIDFLVDMDYMVVGAWETEELVIVCIYGSHQIIEISKKQKKVLRHYDFQYGILNFGQIMECENAKNIVFSGLEELMEIDYQVGSIKKHNVNYRNKDIWGCMYDNGLLWINKALELLIYDPVLCKIITHIDIPDSLIKDNRNSYCMDVHISQNYVWFIPLHSNRFMRLNKTDKKIDFIQIGTEQKNGINYVLYHTIYVRENRYLYLFSTDENKNIVLDMENAAYKDVNYMICDAEYQRCINKQGLQCGDFVKESQNIGIEELMKPNNLEREKDKKLESNIGNQIFCMLS